MKSNIYFDRIYVTYVDVEKGTYRRKSQLSRG